MHPHGSELDGQNEMSQEINARKSLHVLHILDHSRPLLSGYSVRSHSLISAQKKIGFFPKVLTGPLHQIEDRSANDIMLEGISYERTELTGGIASLALEKRLPILREAMVVKLLREKILSVLDKHPFDIIHAHSPALCGLAALQASKARNVPFVYEIRAFWEDAAVDQNKTQPLSPRYIASRGLEGYVARRADAVIGIARHILDDLRSRGIEAEKLFHVPNGVDAERFVALPRDAKLGSELGLNGDPVMGFIGSLYRYEGILWLVNATSELRRRGVGLQLLIVGQGEDMPEVQAAIQKAGAQKYIHAVGQVPHDQVGRYYSLMDIMVYPRRRIRLTELTTPLKPLEAMAQSKPVLASDVGGIRELVEPEIPCLLFEPDSIDDFCNKASRLLSSEILRRQIGESGRQMVLRDKDWKILAQKYISVYELARISREASKSSGH